jgi:hypothetical protein
MPGCSGCFSSCFGMLGLAIFIVLGIVLGIWVYFTYGWPPCAMPYLGSMICSLF